MGEVGGWRLEGVRGGGQGLGVDTMLSRVLLQEKRDIGRNSETVVKTMGSLPSIVHNRNESITTPIRRYSRTMVITHHRSQPC